MADRRPYNTGQVAPVVSRFVMTPLSPEFEPHSRRLVPGWAFSCAVHFVVLLVFGWLAELQNKVPGKIGSPSAERSVEIVLRPRALPISYEDEAPPNLEVADVNPVDDRAAIPSLTKVPVTLPEIAPATALSVESIRSAVIPASASSMSENHRSPGSNSDSNEAVLETSIFGVRGSGRKFVYIFDRSASMAGGPLRAAKAELQTSLRTLEHEHQFQIIFYNDHPESIPLKHGKKELLVADSAGLTAASAFIDKMLAEGGTEHLAALRLALRWQPDAIFFLTDGSEPELLPAELGALRRLNQGTAIHTIEFGLGPKRTQESFLERLAAQNGGRYGYVDVTRLP